MKQTPVVCHMASHMALVMSSVTSGECVVCAIVNKLRKKSQLAAYFDKKQCAVERIESHKLLANIFSAIGLDFDKNFGKWSYVWGTVIYCQFNTNMTILVEIES